MHKFVVLFFVALLCSCKSDQHQYNGYIDADLTYLSSDISGRLVDLLVNRGQGVKHNQLLFKLEQTGEYFDVAISKFNQKNLLAQRSEIITQIQYEDINYKRSLRMRTQNAASQNDVDLARKNLDVLKDQLYAINFQIKSSDLSTSDKRWQLQRKESRATNTGIIFDTYVTKGEYVPAGQPVLSLLTKRNIKVVFFVAEGDLSTITLNSKVAISSDGNLKLAKGTINYISNIAQYTPPIIYSRENREELVFRVEARIDDPHLNQLHLGQPVSLEFVQ